MILIKAIPNLLTLLNISCGIVGIILVLKGDLKMACQLIWLAVLFDFSDGFSARLLKAQSEIGKQLDSLADLVSFGVLPGFVYYQLFSQMEVSDPFIYSFLSVPLLSAIRLAKFNIDENQTDEFIGLSTTAHAIFISSLVFAWLEQDYFTKLLGSPFVWLTLMVIGSILLVSPIRLLALKFKSFSLTENWIKYLLIMIGLTLMIMLKAGGLAMAIIAYILLSVVYNVSRNKNQ